MASQRRSSIPLRLLGNRQIVRWTLAAAAFAVLGTAAAADLAATSFRGHQLTASGGGSPAAPSGGTATTTGTSSSGSTGTTSSTSSTSGATLQPPQTAVQGGNGGGLAMTGAS